MGRRRTRQSLDSACIFPKSGDFGYSAMATPRFTDHNNTVASGNSEQTSPLPYFATPTHGRERSPFRGRRWRRV